MRPVNAILALVISGTLFGGSARANKPPLPTGRFQLAHWFTDKRAKKLIDSASELYAQGNRYLAAAKLIEVPIHAWSRNQAGLKVGITQKKYAEYEKLRMLLQPEMKEVAEERGFDSEPTRATITNP
jgi:hypothetical protein